MAAFRVGQRVRIVNPEDSDYLKCGTVVGRHNKGYDTWVRGVMVEPGPVCTCYGVDIDGVGAFDPADGLAWAYVASDLAPLTDPKADAFIERVKSWKPEPEPVLPVDQPALEEVRRYYQGH